MNEKKEMLIKILEDSLIANESRYTKEELEAYFEGFMDAVKATHTSLSIKEEHS